MQTLRGSLAKEDILDRLLGGDTELDIEDLLGHSEGGGGRLDSRGGSACGAEESEKRGEEHVDCFGCLKVQVLLV